MFKKCANMFERYEKKNINVLEHWKSTFGKKEDKEKFLDEIYFFLVDNNMDSVLNEKYRANWW